MKKGTELKYLDYTIKMCSNNDGIVLLKEGVKAKRYECHLGNFGKNVLLAKQAAVLFFMIARPQAFATHIYHYLTGSSTSHEWFALKKVILHEGLEIPEELREDGSINFSISFNGIRLADLK